MRIALLIAFAAASDLLVGQVITEPSTPPANVHSESLVTRGPKTDAAVAVPILGYITGANSAELYSIVGTASKPHLGQMIALPSGVSRVYLPPRQQYALVVKNTSDPISLISLRKASTDTGPQEVELPGAMSGADWIVFSTTGNTAVLFSEAQERLQIFTHLSSQPSFSREMSTHGKGSPVTAAISDDTDYLVVEFDDRVPMYSFHGGPLQYLPSNYRPADWLFLPKTHNLVITDPERREIVLISDPKESAGAPQTLATSIAANHLACTRDGEHVLAVSPAEHRLVDIHLASGTAVKSESANIASIAPLRDGYTFLLSSFPSLSLIKLAPSSGEPPSPFSATQTNSSPDVHASH